MRFPPATSCSFLSPDRIVKLSDRSLERLPVPLLPLRSYRSARVAKSHTPVGSSECKAHQALGDLLLGPKPSSLRQLGGRFLVWMTGQGHPRVRSPTLRETATHDHSEESSSLLGQQVAGHSMHKSASVPSHKTYRAPYITSMKSFQKKKVKGEISKKLLRQGTNSPLVSYP